MIFVLPSSASPDSPYEDAAPTNTWDETPGVRVRQVGTIAVIHTESHAALRDWLITQPLYAAFSWELEGHTATAVRVDTARSTTLD